MRRTPAKRTKVLVAVHINTFFTELRQIAKRLREEDGFDPVVMFYSYPTAHHDIAWCHREGISCIDEHGRTPDNFLHGQNVKWFAARARSLLQRSAVIDIGLQTVALARRQREIAELLTREQFDLVVLGGDMTGYDTSAMIAACHEVGINAAIVPSTMSNGLEQAEVYSEDPRHSLNSWVNRRAASRYPKWAVEHKGRIILREPGTRILAMERLGLAPPLPWIFNSGKADVIAIESLAMFDYYVNAGLPPGNLTITGSPSDDALAQVLSDRTDRKERLCRQLGLNVDKQLLLTALPPDSLYMKGGRPACDFTTYAELVRFWIDSIATLPGLSKVVSLHPSVDPKAMRHLETADLKIATDRTAELVPLCDIYLASVSSTIRWAIACGKPVINYDVYRYRYTDYLGLKGVLATEEQDEFRQLLQRMATDAAFREEIAGFQRADAPRWGTLDGKAGERILALFQSMVDRKH